MKSPNETASESVPQNFSWKSLDYALILIWLGVLLLAFLFAAAQRIAGEGIATSQLRLFGQRPEFLVLALFFGASKVRFGISTCGFSAWGIFATFTPLFFFVSLAMQSNGAAVTSAPDTSATETYIAVTLFFVPAMACVALGAHLFPRWFRCCGLGSGRSRRTPSKKRQ